MTKEEDLLALLATKEKEIALLGLQAKANRAATRPTTREAIRNFYKTAPKQQYTYQPLKVDVATLRNKMARADTAGDKRFDQKELKSVLVSSGFGEEEAHDMCEGYFRIADDRGKINFEGFLEELVRMCVFKATRKLQYKSVLLDEQKDEFDSYHRMELDEVRKAFNDTGVGEITTEEIIKDCLENQVGVKKANPTLSYKQVVTWYFYKYYPDPPEPEVETIKHKQLDYEQSQSYVEKTVNGLLVALGSYKKSVEGGMNEDSEMKKVVFLSGKLMALLEVAEASTGADDVFMSEIIGKGEIEEKIQQAIASATDMGVDLMIG